MSVHFSDFLKLWRQKNSGDLKCNIYVVFLKLLFSILSCKSGIIDSAFMIVLY